MTIETCWIISEHLPVGMGAKSIDTSKLKTIQKEEMFQRLLENFKKLHLNFT